jgi:hypothetical protein
MFSGILFGLFGKFKFILHSKPSCPSTTRFQMAYEASSVEDSCWQADTIQCALRIIWLVFHYHLRVATNSTLLKVRLSAICL